MNSFKLRLDRHSRYVVAAVGLLFSTLAPAVVPAFAAAAQVTDRSIGLSSSVKAATGVSYQVKFTTTTVAQSFVLQFCSNTPLIGETCTAPSGLTVASATTATSGATITNRATANKLVVEYTALGTPGAMTIDIAGITNPTSAGALYARIITYDETGANALTEYTTTALGADAKDQGSVALSITDGVSVTGAVLESMTFCVSGETISTTSSCVGSGAAAPALTAPTLKLGNNVGGIIALDSQAVYTGTIYTQISTNAAKGAIVSLKSNAVSCGGLIRSSDTSACDITAAGTSGTISAGDSKFGVKTGSTSSDASGTIQPSGSYDNTNYRMNYVAGNGTGVTSTYGDPLLNTNSLPANNKNMSLTFGASVSNNTPAGNYSANLSLIATGKF